MKGLLLDKQNDLLIAVQRDQDGKIAGGLVLGELLLQDAYAVLAINQGELKEDPIAGVNLIALIRSKASRERIRTAIKIGFARSGIDFDAVKDRIKIENIKL